MDDTQTTDQTTDNQPQTDGPKAPQTDGDPAPGAEDEITRMKVQLTRAQEDLEEARRVREAARRLVTNDGTFDEQYEQAARLLMADAGVEPPLIDEWVESQRAALHGNQTEGEQMSEDIRPTEAAKAGGDQRDEYIKTLESRLQALEAKGEDTRLQYLEDRFNQTLDSVVNEYDPVKGLIGKLEALSGSETSDERVARIREDIKRATLDNIRRKTAAGGKFDPSWFEREAKEAADQEVAKLRAVIGDPDRLMRVSETVTGEDQIRRGGPVEDPKWESGMGLSEAQGKAKDWTAAKVMEALDELARPGDSRA